MQTSVIQQFVKNRSNTPVRKMEREGINIEDTLDELDQRQMRLEAMVCYMNQVFSLYSYQGQYFSIFQFNVDKLQRGPRDSLRNNWRDAQGRKLDFDRGDFEGAYCIFNSKAWVDAGGPARWELPVEYWPDAVKTAKADLITGGNVLDKKGFAIINGKRYNLTLAA